MNDNDVLDILRTSAQQASLRAQDQQVVQQRAAALGAAPRELPTVRIDVDRNAVGHPLSFIIERGTTQAPSLGNLPCTQFGVEDLRQPDVDPADLDLIVTACNHLLELSADTQQHDCPLCHTPRVRDHEAIIHLDPHSDQPQQAQWRIAQAN